MSIVEALKYIYSSDFPYQMYVTMSVVVKYYYKTLFEFPYELYLKKNLQFRKNREWYMRDRMINYM